MSDIKSVLTVLNDHDLTAPNYFEMIVDSIAEDYRRDTMAWESSRRITSIIKDLQNITDAANKLGSILKGLHPQTFQAMGGDWRLPGQIPSMERDKIIDNTLLAELSPANNDRENVGLVGNIYDLSELASSTRDELEGTWKMRREDGRIDAGGNETISSMTSDHPKLVLARSCRNLLISEFGAKISGKLDDLFYAFYAAVYEYASGREPEEKGAGLERYVKQVMAENR